MPPDPGVPAGGAGEAEGDGPVGSADAASPPPDGPEDGGGCADEAARPSRIFRRHARPAPAKPGDWADERTLAELLADAAEVTTEGVDLEAGRERVRALVHRHRLLARTTLMVGVAGIAGVWLLGPLFLSAAGGGLAEGEGDARWFVTGITAVLTLGTIGWTWWSNRRLERALASGPPAMRRATEDIGREMRLGDRLVAACGLLAVPGILLVAWDQVRSDGSWWYTLLLLAAAGFFGAETARRSRRVLREDRAARRGRRGDGGERPA